MGDRRDEKSQYISLPIPTYEEATSSRPTSSQRGPEEVSDDAERQGLLGNNTTSAARNGPYRAPTSESPRPSEDSDLDLHEMTGDHDDEDVALRRSMEQMEMMEPEDATGSQRQTRLSKSIAQLSHRWRRIRFPRFTAFTAFTSHLPTIPDQYRLSLPIIARLAALFTIAALIYVLFALDIIPSSRNFTTRFDPESVRSRVQAEADPRRIADYLQYITSFDHVAGTEGDLYLAEWVREMWTNADLDKVAMQEYYVYLNYPTKDGRRVAIVDPPEKRWEAVLEEENVYGDKGREKQQTLNWHGSSKSGNVTGPLIYANGGSREDFQKLKDMGVDLTGSIVLVRYYHTQSDRSMKVKAAEAAGAAGCIIYSDPKEDGFLQGEPLPGGQWRPSDAVQRGSVALSSWVLGDALTPGWASTVKADRVSEDDNPGLVKIPSLPLSWRDAQKLLQALKGHGQKVPTDDWIGGVPDVEWWIGDKTSPQVNLMNLNDENKNQRIWNVHGLIQGMETSAKKIVVGNHRDAWCFGSVDPGSGTAVMMEVVNIFGTLRRLGWRPLRTIEFVSWDAEEYNFIGSTEYVEDHIDAIRAGGVSYLNVDVGVSGGNFRAAGSPLFVKPLMHVLDRVGDPVANVTLRQLWEEQGAKLEGLGAGSDYVAFQNLAGTSSLDFGFEGDKDNNYPYHSCYETFEWMQRFGDPDFQYHRTLAQVWALLILELADKPILSYDLKAYAAAVVGYVDQLDKDVKALNTDTGAFDTKPLRQAAEVFVKQADDFHKFDDAWAQQVMGGAGGFETNIAALKRIEHNERLADFETNLLDLPATGEEGPYGIPGRQQFKHIISGPELWAGYDATYFPAVRDALANKDWASAQELLERASRILTRAAVLLNK